MRLAKTLAVGLIAFATLPASMAAAVPLISIDDVSPGGGTGVNTFAAELPAAGAVAFADTVSFSLNQRARLTFTAVAAESDFDNTFTVDGLGTLSETGDFGLGDNLLTSAGIGSLTGIFDAGSLDALFRFATSGNAIIGAPLTAFLGVYSALGTGQHSTFFLAFDDDGAGPDDNHDDFIVRVDVSAVPLPGAVWALLAGLAGLGVVGRRRATA